jgi:hypothetical protein
MPDSFRGVHFYEAAVLDIYRGKDPDSRSGKSGKKYFAEC